MEISKKTREKIVFVFKKHKEETENFINKCKFKNWAFNIFRFIIFDFWLRRNKYIANRKMEREMW